MSQNERNLLLQYYKAELSYLRKMGAAFGREHPKIAGRLELGIDQSPDPHVERLIESFAYLTARIQYNLDQEFPRISTALLDILYPQFLSPIPAMTVAEFEPDPLHGGLLSGYSIPKNTPLHAKAESSTGEHKCRFRTCYPLTLWPVQVVDAGFEARERYRFLDQDDAQAGLKSGQVAAVIRIRLRSLNQTFDKMDIRSLRFYLNAERVVANSLYELIFCHVHKLVLLPEGDPDRKPIFLPDDAIAPVGFGQDEAVLPYPPNTHRGYRLIQEYFVFPQKFLFFDLNDINRHESQKRFDILLLLSQRPARELYLGPQTFKLGCTPVINLFSKTSDPVRMDGRQTRYPLCPDKRRERTTEIHSILSVSAAPDPDNRAEQVEPFFSFNHYAQSRSASVYWYAQRNDSRLKSLPGTQMEIAFTDLDFNPRLPHQKTLYAHTLCTNRRLAEDVPEWARLYFETDAPVAQIRTLFRPTPPLDPPMEGKTLWRLISHLSLNYLSLGSNRESLRALQEILKLYSFSERQSTEKEINGLAAMRCRPVVRRIGQNAWKGFCRGIEISLEFDESLYEGSSAFLLAAVLNRFFALYSSVNSFTRLIIYSKQREGVWNQWPPLAGEQAVH